MISDTSYAVIANSAVANTTLSPEDWDKTLIKL